MEVITAKDGVKPSPRGAGRTPGFIAAGFELRAMDMDSTVATPWCAWTRR